MLQPNGSRARSDLLYKRVGRPALFNPVPLLRSPGASLKPRTRGRGAGWSFGINAINAHSRLLKQGGILYSPFRDSRVASTRAVPSRFAGVPAASRLRSGGSLFCLPRARSCCILTAAGLGPTSCTNGSAVPSCSIRRLFSGRQGPASSPELGDEAPAGALNLASSLSPNGTMACCTTVSAATAASTLA